MSTVYNVSNAAQLMNALSKANDGATIKLESGDYGRLVLSQYTNFDVDFDAKITITSADSTDPASFSGLALGGVSNLTFDGVVFDYNFARGDQQHTRDFVIHNSSDIAIINSEFDGDLATSGLSTDIGFGMATGLEVRNSDRVTIENTEFSEFYRAALITDSKDVIVRGNEIHDIRADGLNFAANQGVVIEDNHIHNFTASYGSGDHRDMIQFWTTSTKTPSTDITIRGNTLDIGEGSYTQAIFMRNEVVDTRQAGKEMYYQNVVIEDNLIYNGHLHGITVGETDGLVIRHNSVLRVEDTQNPEKSDSSVWVPKINVSPASDDVVIQNNVTGGVTGHKTQSDWTVGNNIVLQDTLPGDANYYGNVYATSSRDATDRAHDFVVLPGGLLDGSTAGVRDTSATDTPGTGVQADIAMPTSIDFHVSQSASNNAARIFDAEFDAALLDKLPAGTLFEWDFGDGHGAQGKLVEHIYEKPGHYAAKLTVTLPDGSSMSEMGELSVAGENVLSFREDGQFSAFDFGTETVLGTRNAPIVDTGEGLVMDLGNKGTVHKVQSDHLDPLRGVDNMTIAMDIQADTAGSWGEVFRSHGSFTAKINTKGELQFHLSTTEKTEAVLVGKGMKLNDGASHKVVVTFEDGLLGVTVDGVTGHSIDVGGEFKTGALRDLSFGNPWGQKNFDGKIKSFDITTDAGVFSAPRTLDDGDGTLDTVNPDVIDTRDIVPGLGDDMPLLGGLAEDGGFNLTSIIATNPVKAHHDAVLTQTGDAVSISLDGHRDYVNLGRIEEFEKSDMLGFTVEFDREDPTNAAQRLVWNHEKIGLSVREDGLMVNVATADKGFKAYKVTDLGLNNTDSHRATVLVDSDADRLQIVLNDEIVLDIQGDADIDLDRAGPRDWSIGTAWNEFYDGDVTDFAVNDNFDFMSEYVATDDTFAI